MTEITYDKLKELGFRPWDIMVEDDTSWLLESPEFVADPSFRITIQRKNDEVDNTHKVWQCVAWYGDYTNKKNKKFIRTVVDNIQSIEDIQKVADICRININLLQ